MPKLSLNKIRTDGGTQCRTSGTDPATVRAYADRMRAGDLFPPVTVYFDGSSNWLADGFHRFEAAQVAGLRTIAADVIEGTRKDAVIYGAGANTAHGQPLSARDRARVVMRLLQDDDVKHWSDRKIAQHVGVSNATVAKYRQIVQSGGETGRIRTYNDSPPPAITVYPSDNVFGIPRLQLEHQATELLLPAIKWGTQARRAPIGGTAHFYTDDYKFRALWDKPHQLLQANPASVIECNYSTYVFQPRAIAIGEMFKKRWMSRYWAGEGVKIFIDMFVERCFFDLALMGVPKGWRAYATRAYIDSLEHVTDAYKAAARRAGTYDLLFVVYGHESMREICDRRGWLYVPEDIKVKHGRSKREPAQASE